MSLVGRNIRGILHQLGEAFELFAEQQVYLVSQAANDLNFTFVVDESQGDRLVDQLHELLIPRSRTDRSLGPTWDQLFAPQSPAPSPLGSYAAVVEGAAAGPACGSWTVATVLMSTIARRC